MLVVVNWWQLGFEMALSLVFLLRFLGRMKAPNEDL